jgi:hypothetical protein
MGWARPEGPAMPYSHLTQVCDPETLWMLVQVFESAFLDAKRELLSRDLTEEQELEARQRLASIILNAYANGEDDPELLKHIALATFGGRAAARLSPS